MMAGRDCRARAWSNRVRWGLLLSLATLIHAQAQMQGRVSDVKPQALFVVCAPERVVVPAGDTVHVRAWATDSDGAPIGEPLRIHWSADAGSISGSDRALWRLDVDPTSADDRWLKARVEVAADRGVGHCEVEIRVRGRSDPVPGDRDAYRRRSELLSARAYLLRGRIEPTEYGLLSYLLFPAPPRDDAERTRYLKAIEAWLRVLVPTEDLLAQEVRASRINLTLIPLTVAVTLPERFDDENAARSVAVDLLRAYDYARARELLSAFEMTGAGRGPFVVSRETRSSGPAQGRLLVDMTGVSPALIWDWMSFFSWIVAQERSWSDRALQKLGLNLRNVLAVTSVATPVVLTSIGRWIYVLRLR